MAATKLASELELPLSLDRKSALPLQQQLGEQLKAMILNGQLPAGTRLPSTRALASALGISRTVAVFAYDELFAEGYIEGRHGSGTYVGCDLPPLPRPTPPPASHAPRWLKPLQHTLPDEAEEAHAINFRLGQPSISSLSLRTWRETWRPITNALPPNNYDSPAGNAELRAALAAYLGRSRGLACDPANIIITSGAIQALDLIARATLSIDDPVGFEEPGYPTARQILLNRGCSLLPLPIDEDGLQVEALPEGDAAPLLVYTTPSHQYPLATRLSIARRMALLKWAEVNESLIVEDDYDREFRFDAPPLPALAGLDKAGCVAYIGTFSKVLAPSLRVGYLVAPPALRERVSQLKHLTDGHTSWPVQQMLARFINEGHLDRHIRRMRHQYAEKRHALEQTLAPIAELARLRGLEAGLHAYLELRSDLDATRIAELAYKKQVIVSTLDAYYLGSPDRSGLLLGYGGLEVHEIIQGARILANVIERVAASKRAS